MAARCTVCNHPKRKDIDQYLVMRALSFREISERFELGRGAVYRHYCEHVPLTLMRAKTAKEAFSADALLEKMTRSETRLEDVATKFHEKTNDKQPEVARGAAGIMVQSEKALNPLWQLGDKIRKAEEATKLSVTLRHFLVRFEELAEESFPAEVKTTINKLVEESLEYVQTEIER